MTWGDERVFILQKMMISQGNENEMQRKLIVHAFGIVYTTIRADP